MYSSLTIITTMVILHLYQGKYYFCIRNKFQYYVAIFYEYAMAIGKSLDYKDNCDAFLKLILKRKNLNAAWILESRNDKLVTTYSIPSGQLIKTSVGADLKHELESISNSKKFDWVQKNNDEKANHC